MPQPLFVGRVSLRRLWVLTLVGIFAFETKAEEIRADLDYFPSRLHAAVFRNWDIVPHERLATVLDTDVSALESVGRKLGLPKTKPLTPEEIRRNIEIVLRRNWPLFPRSQIEGLLNFSPAEFDDFLSKEIFLRALLAEPPLEQALIVSARTPSNPSVRLGLDMTGPPVISTLLLGWVRRMSGSAVSLWRSARCRSVTWIEWATKVSVRSPITFAPEP